MPYGSASANRRCAAPAVLSSIAPCICAFFGLNEKPFAITPDPRYLFLSERHAEALAHLLYGVTEAGGFIQLTGEVGTGKTTVVRSLLAQTPKHAEIALILNPRMTAPEFLLTICEELGIGVQDSATGSLKDLVDILSQYLLRAHGGGKRVVLVVDEAQNLAPEVLEQVRLLTNLETNTQKLLQIILIGQPELRDLLDRNELRQLAQRITGRYHLCPLTPEETAAYVRHRLRVAGATADIFTPAALREVHRLSRRRTAAHQCAVRSRAAGRLYPGPPPGRPRVCPARRDGGVRATRCGRGGCRGASRRSPPRSWSVRCVGRMALRALESDGAAAGRDSRGPFRRRGPFRSAGIRRRPQPPPVPRAPPPRRWARCSPAHAAETTPDAAFGELFSIWGAHYLAGTADPCTQAAAQGLECYVQKGSIAQLRLYNRPAILMLTDDADAAHQVVLTGLDDDHAHVDIGSDRQQVSIGDLSHYWFGDFILLWRPATHDPKALAPGHAWGRDPPAAPGADAPDGKDRPGRCQRCLRWRAVATRARLPARPPVECRWRGRNADPGGAEQRAGETGLAATCVAAGTR